MSEKWQKNIEKNIKEMRQKIINIDDRIQKIKDVETGIEQLLIDLKAMKDTKENDKTHTAWKSLGLFLLGGITLLFILSLLAIITS